MTTPNAVSAETREADAKDMDERVELMDEGIRILGSDCDEERVYRARFQRLAHLSRHVVKVQEARNNVHAGGPVWTGLGDLILAIDVMLGGPDA